MIEAIAHYCKDCFGCGHASPLLFMRDVIQARGQGLDTPTLPEIVAVQYEGSEGLHITSLRIERF